jgi:HK97 family phage prohead protease
MNATEIRCATTELRAEGTSKKPRITGMAARFNVKTTLQPGLNEVIRSGAFRQSISDGDDVVLNFNHDRNKIAARVSAGTLRLRESAEGLLFDADVDLGISYISDWYKLIAAGLITECSFAFGYREGGDFATVDPDDKFSVLSTLTSVYLGDVSAVTYPAYGNGATSVSARNVVSKELQERCAQVLAGASESSSVAVDARSLAQARARLEVAKLR